MNKNLIIKLAFYMATTFCTNAFGSMKQPIGTLDHPSNDVTFYHYNNGLYESMNYANDWQRPPQRYENDNMADKFNKPMGCCTLIINNENSIILKTTPSNHATGPDSDSQLKTYEIKSQRMVNNLVDIELDPSISNQLVVKLTLRNTNGTLAKSLLLSVVELIKPTVEQQNTHLPQSPPLPAEAKFYQSTAKIGITPVFAHNSPCKKEITVSTNAILKYYSKEHTNSLIAPPNELAIAINRLSSDELKQLKQAFDGAALYASVSGQDYRITDIYCDDVSVKTENRRGNGIYEFVQNSTPRSNFPTLVVAGGLAIVLAIITYYKNSEQVTDFWHSILNIVMKNNVSSI